MPPDQSDAEKLIAEFIEADAKMTPGPWQTGPHWMPKLPQCIVYPHPQYSDARILECLPQHGAFEEANASGIALHRNKSRRIADGLAIAREALKRAAAHHEEMYQRTSGDADCSAMGLDEYHAKSAKSAREALAAIDSACRGEK